MANATNQYTPGLLSSGSPADFLLQQQQIDRQRKVAELLRQGSLQAPEGQMVSGHYVAPSGTQYLAKLAQGLIGNTQEKDADARQLDLVGRQNKFMADQADELRSAITPRPGTPDVNLGPGDARRQFAYMEHTDEAAPDIIREGKPGFTPTQPDLTAAIAKYLNNTGNSTKAVDYVIADAKNQMLARTLKGEGGAAAAPAASADSGGAGQVSNSMPIGGNDGRVPGVGPASPTAQQGGNSAPTYTTRPSGASNAQLSPQTAYQYLDPAQRNVVDSYLADGKADEAIKYMGEALKPHMSSDGKMMVYRNGQAVVVPGSVQAFGAYKREEKQYDAPIQLDAEDGSKISLSPPEWADYQKTGKLPLRLLPPATRQAIQDEADRTGQPATVNLKTPLGMIGGQVIPQTTGRVGVSPSNAAKQQQEKQGAFFGDTYADLQKKAMTSNDNIAKYQRLTNLLDGVDTGKFTGTALEIKKAAKALGIDLGVADNVGPLEAARALTSELALVARNPDSGMGMPGAMSDADRNFLVNMQPGIEQTPAGRKLMIDAAVKMERRKQEIAQLARSYKNGQLDNGFFQVVQDYANAHPLFGDAPAPAAPNSSPASSPAKDVYEEFGLKRRTK